MEWLFQEEVTGTGLAESTPREEREAAISTDVRTRRARRARALRAILADAARAPEAYVENYVVGRGAE